MNIHAKIPSDVHPDIHGFFPSPSPNAPHLAPWHFVNFFDAKRHAATRTMQAKAHDSAPHHHSRIVIVGVGPTTLMFLLKYVAELRRIAATHHLDVKIAMFEKREHHGYDVSAESKDIGVGAGQLSWDIWGTETYPQSVEQLCFLANDGHYHSLVGALKVSGEHAAGRGIHYTTLRYAMLMLLNAELHGLFGSDFQHIFRLFRGVEIGLEKGLTKAEAQMRTYLQWSSDKITHWINNAYEGGFLTASSAAPVPGSSLRKVPMGNETHRTYVTFTFAHGVDKTKALNNRQRYIVKLLNIGNNEASYTYRDENTVKRSYSVVCRIRSGAEATFHKAVYSGASFSRALTDNPRLREVVSGARGYLLERGYTISHSAEPPSVAIVAKPGESTRFWLDKSHGIFDGTVVVALGKSAINMAGDFLLHLDSACKLALCLTDTVDLNVWESSLRDSALFSDRMPPVGVSYTPKFDSAYSAALKQITAKLSTVEVVKDRIGHLLLFDPRNPFKDLPSLKQVADDMIKEFPNIVKALAKSSTEFASGAVLIQAQLSWDRVDDGQPLSSLFPEQMMQKSLAKWETEMVDPMAANSSSAKQFHAGMKAKYPYFVSYMVYDSRSQIKLRQYKKP